MRRFEKVSWVKEGIDKVCLPTRSTKNSAAYDFYAPFTVTIKPKTSVFIMTGIKVYMENDEVLLMFVRSSIGINKKLMLANSTGVIDADFVDNPDNEGEITIGIYNYGEKTQIIEAGSRIAQGVFVKYLTTDNDKEPKISRIGGIGSTGS